MKVIAKMMVRGTGSTLKRKNAYPILGKPMLWWSLTEVGKADFIDEVFVFTEDEEMACITRECGAHVVARSRDQVFVHGGFSNPDHWMRHMDEHIQAKCGTTGDIIVHLNCNYCLMTAEILERMYVRLMEDMVADSIVAVSRTEPHLYMENPKNGLLFPIWQCGGMDRQEYPDLYRASAITIIHRPREERNTKPVRLHHVVASENLLDVDSIEDVRLAEYYLMRRLGAEVVLPEAAYDRFRGNAAGRLRKLEGGAG